VLLLTPVHRAAENGLAAAKPESVGMSSERLQRINELVQRHLKAGSFSGAVRSLRATARSPITRRTV